MTVGEPQPPHYVIPSVAEESEMLAVDSFAGFLDSSATLGMTSPNKFRMNGLAHCLTHYPPLRAMRAQVSRRGTARLKTGAPGRESTASAQK